MHSCMHSCMHTGSIVWIQDVHTHRSMHSDTTAYRDMHAACTQYIVYIIHGTEDRLVSDFIGGIYTMQSHAHNRGRRLGHR